MKKAIILVGSARNGNSLYLAQRIADNTKADVVQIASKNISMCTGCLECDETKKCVFADDMVELISDIVKSNAVIIISPTRWGLMSGDVKLFIDRLNPIATTEELVGKELITVAIGQSEQGDSSIQHALDSLAFFGESAGMELIGSFPIYECLSNEDLVLNASVADEVTGNIIKLLETEK
ncbi:hypothetical protein AGMMS49957_18110 [Synergistales bacterium]|nr:hypothetical protein AGMMS49957_18110 [Synergistales bacterium]